MTAATLQPPRPVEKEQRHWSRAFLAAHGEGHSKAGCPPEAAGGADVHLQPVEDLISEQVMPEGGCDPMRSLCWSRLLTEPVDSWREDPTLEQACWQNL